MKPSENLIAAKTELLAHGWRQNRVKDEQGHMCIVGALDVVDAMLIDTDSFEMQCLAEIIGGTHSDGVGGDIAVLTWFNDCDGRTFSEISDLFDEAILLAKEREA